MCADSSYRKSGSPQASTEVSSLQLNKTKNKEALEKGLRTRRSIQDLVNQGILLNPSISHADKVRQLQRAKTSDILKQKIKQRPDRQYLISHHILRDDKPGASPFVLEQCHNLEKYQLKESLNTKLISRPGSLELVEKGVLQVDPGVDWLIRLGSIQYPRVEHERLATIDEHTVVPSPPPLPPCTQAVSSPSNIVRSTSVSRCTVSTKATCSRSIKDETVVYKVGSLTFHQYRPNSSSSSSPSLSVQSTFEQKQRAREVQQAEMLRLQDTARAHRLVEQELCQRVKMACKRSSVCETQQEESWKSENSPVPSSPASQATSSIGSTASPLPANNLQPSVLLKSKSPNCSRTGNNSCSNRVLTCLEQLSVSQLRAECKDRNLVCTRLKAALIRQLEPFKDQILAKYSDPPLNHAEQMKDGVDCSQSSLVLPGSYSELVLSQQQPPLPSPVWMSTIPTSVSYLTLHAVSSSSLITPTYTRSISLCTPIPSTTVIPQAFQLYSTPSHLCQSSQPSALLTEQCAALRHSASAPFINDGANGLISNSNSQSQSSNQGDSHSIVSATPLIPVAFSSASVPPTALSCNPTSISPLKFDSLVSTSQSSIFYLPSDLLTCPQSPAFVSQPNQSSNLNNLPICNDSPSNSHSTNSQSTENADHLSAQHYDESVIRCSDLTNASQVHFSSTPLTQTVSHFASVDNQPLGIDDAPLQTGSNEMDQVNQPTDSAPSLHQIEEMWLRIRHLRREIVRVRSSINNQEDYSDQSNSETLKEIEHKHDHLATLCRLLIVERLDALEKMLSSAPTTSAQAQLPNRPLSDLDIEHKLLVHYLGKLGGTSSFSNVLLSNTNNRRSSSFSSNTCGLLDSNQPDCTSIKTSDLLMYRTNNSSDLTLSSFSSQNFSAPLVQNNIPSTNDSTTTQLVHGQMEQQCASVVLVDGEQSITSGISDLDQLAEPNGDYSDSGAAEAIDPSDQISSPMTTDMLFEFWNSVVDDSTMSNTENNNHKSDPTDVDNVPENLPTNGSKCFNTEMDSTPSNDTCYFSSSNGESMDLCNHNFVTYEPLSTSLKNRQDGYSTVLPTDSLSEFASSVGSNRDVENSSRCLQMINDMDGIFFQSTPQAISANDTSILDNYQSNMESAFARKHNQSNQEPSLSRRTFWPLCPETCNTPRMQDEEQELGDILSAAWNSNPTFPATRTSHHPCPNAASSISRLNTPANEFADRLFGSDLTDLMDTSDSVTTMPPLKINWTVGTL